MSGGQLHSPWGWELYEQVKGDKFCPLWELTASINGRIFSSNRDVEDLEVIRDFMAKAVS